MFEFYITFAQNLFAHFLFTTFVNILSSHLLFHSPAYIQNSLTTLFFGGGWVPPFWPLQKWRLKKLPPMAAHNPYISLLNFILKIASCTTFAKSKNILQGVASFISEYQIPNFILLVLDSNCLIKRLLICFYHLKSVHTFFNISFEI